MFQSKWVLRSYDYVIQASYSPSCEEEEEVASPVPDSDLGTTSIEVRLIIMTAPSERNPTKNISSSSEKDTYKHKSISI